MSTDQYVAYLTQAVAAGNEAMDPQHDTITSSLGNHDKRVELLALGHLNATLAVATALDRIANAIEHDIAPAFEGEVPNA